MEAAIRCPMYSPTLCRMSVHFLAVGEMYVVISVCMWCACVCVKEKVVAGFSRRSGLCNKGKRLTTGVCF